LRPGAAIFRRAFFSAGRTVDGDAAPSPRFSVIARSPATPQSIWHLPAMRALLAFDKFKDSLTAQQACDLAADALRATHRDWTLDLCPLADGGEGFCEIHTAAAGG
jgi:hypothetical protein